MRHLNTCFKKLYDEKYPKIDDHLPVHVMYRCSMLARCMLVFELYATILPELLKIDPFELLKVRGSHFFTSFCGPNGHAFDSTCSFSIEYTSIVDQKS